MISHTRKCDSTIIMLSVSNLQHEISTCLLEYTCTFQTQELAQNGVLAIYTRINLYVATK